MTTPTKRTPGKGIVRPAWSDQRAQVNRIAIYKITGFPAIGEMFGAAFAKGAPQKPRYWRVEVGVQAKVSPEHAGVTHPAESFIEAVAIADKIRRRADAFHSLERLTPSRLRPRPGLRIVVGPIPGSVSYIDEHQLFRTPSHAPRR